MVYLSLRKGCWVGQSLCWVKIITPISRFFYNWYLAHWSRAPAICKANKDNVGYLYWIPTTSSSQSYMQCNLPSNIIKLMEKDWRRCRRYHAAFTKSEDCHHVHQSPLVDLKKLINQYGSRQIPDNIKNNNISNVLIQYLGFYAIHENHQRKYDEEISMDTINQTTIIYMYAYEWR